MSTPPSINSPTKILMSEAEFTTSLFAGKVNTNVIEPAVPDTDLVVLANGVQIFDIQTAGARCNSLETNEISVKSGTEISIDNNLLPLTTNTVDLGSTSLRYANLYLGTGLYFPGPSSPLNYYNAAATVPFTYTGALTGSGNYTVTKLGKLCILHIPGLSGASLAASNIELAGLTAEFRPTINGLTFTYIALDNSVKVLGALDISESTGLITLYADVTQSSFANTGNCGMISDIEISYIA